MKVSNISKGEIILYKDQPYQVMDKDFFKLGRGRGHLKAKLKNIQSGAVIWQTFNSEEQVETVELVSKKLQYLYSDQESLHFMDPVSFEQVDMDVKTASRTKKFVTEGSEINVIYWQDKPVSVKIPQKVSLKVVKAEEAVKGDTVSGATKEVTLETGLKVKTPLFIREGDKIIINTESEQYVSRDTQT
jgi:elongation factor P